MVPTVRSRRRRPSGIRANIGGETGEIEGFAAIGIETELMSGEVEGEVGEIVSGAVRGDGGVPLSFLETAVILQGCGEAGLAEEARVIGLKIAGLHGGGGKCEIAPGGVEGGGVVREIKLGVEAGAAARAFDANGLGLNAGVADDDIAAVDAGFHVRELSSGDLFGEIRSPMGRTMALPFWDCISMGPVRETEA